MYLSSSLSLAVRMTSENQENIEPSNGGLLVTMKTMVDALQVAGTVIYEEEFISYVIMVLTHLNVDLSATHN